MAAWGPWQTPAEDNATPYVQWFRDKEYDFDRDLTATFSFLNLGQVFPRNLGDDWTLGKRSSVMIEEQFYGFVPVPTHAKNEEWDTSVVWKFEDVLHQLPEPDNIPENAVIVGVIDTGIALAHRRLRRANGQTRIISSWQQTSEFNSQSFLPCGQELYSKDIDALLRKYARNGDLLGPYDEIAFNREAALSEPQYHLVGQRDLDHPRAHGAHVLDLAAGHDPYSTPSEFLERVRIVSVNLPAQTLHGSAGNFLQFYASYALDRIVFIVNAMWHKKFGGQKEGGFPILLNFSYAMHAGPKDGTMPVEQMMDQIIKDRELNKQGALRIFMPSGNFNLDEGNARLQIMAGEQPKELTWRILPSDHSPNFFELWTHAFDHTNELKPEDFTLELTPPGFGPALVQLAETGKYSDFADFARVYCHKISSTDQTGTIVSRLRFTFCAAQTLDFAETPTKPIAPAGAWKLRVACKNDCFLDLYVQSDQSETAPSQKALKSYFEDGEYQRYLPNGRVRDSFSYPDDGRLLDSGGSVTRVGTVSALSTSENVSAWGSYRTTDGRPSLYSSTAYPELNAPNIYPISGAYPTDDGPGHYGVLASGAQDGSVVAFSGTSMACAMAVRDAVAMMLAWLDSPKGAPGLPTDMQEEVAIAEGQRPAEYQDAAVHKIGPGRMPHPGEFAERTARRLQR
ncbi:MAG: hypothetical protein ACU0GG_16440 [Paracoccaceae bacterium]